MVKQLGLFVFLSVMVVLFLPDLHLIYASLLEHYHDLAEWLADIFSPSKSGTFLQAFFSIVTLPVLIAAFMALIFRFTKSAWIKYSLFFGWAAWIMLISAIVLTGSSVS